MQERTEPPTETSGAHGAGDQQRAARIFSAAKLHWLNNGPKPRTLRRAVYETIEIGHGEDRASKVFDATIVALIILNAGAVIAETVPSVHAQYGPWLWAFEVFTVAVFTVEYLLRLWTAVEVPFLSRMKPWRARITLAKSPALIIDLLAILPFYLNHIMPMDLGVLRMLRLLRFLKLSRYSPAMHTLIRVLKNERKALIGASLLLFTALLFSSTLMYHLEQQPSPTNSVRFPRRLGGRSRRSPPSAMATPHRLRRSDASSAGSP